MKHHTVKQYMKCNPVLISPETTVEQAAIEMAKADCGVLPVGTAKRIIGIITDRDLVIRTLAKRKSPISTKVSEIMSENAHFVNDNATIEEAADMIRKYQINRLLVKDHTGNINGILSLGHFARNAEPSLVAKLVAHTATKKIA